MEPLLLGIDIGTSSCKTALFLPDGTVAAQGGGEYPVLHPHPGWAEQDPDAWWAAVVHAVKTMLAEFGADPARIAGIGVDGQSWSAIPIDGNGNCLANTPIWMDTRAESLCRELNETIGAERIFAVAGNSLQPSYTLPKILWYKRELPDLYNASDKILSSNSYIAYRLTGAVSQDISQAYGYQCFNLRTGTWDSDLMAELGVRPDILPALVDCHEIIGHVTREAALSTGLREGIPVVAGGLDAACGTLGAGVLEDGETQEQGGQAGGMSICASTYHADPSLILSRHVVPGKWLLQGGTVGGGGIMRWLHSELWPELSMRELDAIAESVPAGSDGLVFLPYMAGERSPIWDPHAKGVYYGLDYAKTRGHLIRAGLEGAAFALRHNLETAERAGARAGRLRAMGGAANSRLWAQIKADITARPIDVPASDTATTLGAAMLAGVATGVYVSFRDAVSRTVRVTRTHNPNPENYNIYNKQYDLYVELYESLKELMKKGAST